jgi:hypothetical protein
VLTSLLGRQVPCHAVGPPADGPVSVPGSNIPSQRTLAHSARLIAAGLAGGTGRSGNDPTHRYWG